ncbi:hypothetical protein B0O99DRAFT_713739 [Bisporella sp. PMI_857]|nr:hypothetical protein B0O99DRAFT_713739 [Bisporella sp. PMI_857]
MLSFKKSTKSKNPSLQSFYQREVKLQGGENKSAQGPRRLGDGFTEAEIATLDPLKREWNPTREYEEVSIGDLVPGPKAVMFVGRVINTTTIIGRNPKQPKAAGWHYVTLRDNTAAISIKLYFSSNRYSLKVGQLLSIWTTFISDPSKTEAAVIKGIEVYANIFPGRVTSDHLMIHNNTSTDSACRIPLGYRKEQPLAGLMTLASYIGGGHDGVTDAKILVCVKSIGAKKRVSNRNGSENDLVEVWLMDHSGEIRWTVWNDFIEAVKEWEPGKTILLISSPGYKSGNEGRVDLGVTKETFVDVEPQFGDAQWLRRYAEGRGKKECMDQTFPEGVWDVQAAEYGANVILFKLADVDEWVREEPRRVFTGHINVIIMELSLVKKHYQNMLMCTQCCGVAIYANTLQTACPNCSKLLKLSLNPKIIGTLLDETACIAPGKLLWSEKAWGELLGRSVKEVCEMSIDEIRWLEQRMMFLRCHLVVGWDESVGKLAVLGMRA